MDDIRGRVLLNKTLGITEVLVSIEEGWERYTSDAGDSGMEAGALSRNKVILSKETVWDHNADMDKTARTKKNSKEERQWIKSQKIVKKRNNGEIKEEMDPEDLFKAEMNPEDLSMSTTSLVPYGH